MRHMLYRVIIRIELVTDKLAISAELTDRLNRLASEYGARVVEVVTLPQTTTPAGRA